LIDEIVADPRVAGLAVSLQRLEVSAATRTALRAELKRVRTAGKRLVVHLPRGGATGELLIASVADRVSLGVRTSLGPLGFKMGGTYLRGALDRLGVVPEVLAQGTYKTAGEPLMRETMSEPQREQLGRILDELERELIDGLVEGRKVSREVALGWVNRGLIDAEDALSIGLIDELLNDDELAARLDASSRSGEKEVIAPPAPSALTPVVPGDASASKHADVKSVDASLVTLAGSYLKRRRTKLWKPLRRAHAIAVIEVHGAIVEKGMPSLGGSASDTTLVKLIDAAREHPQIAGVILHVDSPGGGVLASEKIYRAVVNLAEKKPAVACFAGVAASGGYYVSAPCHAIVAQPTTITGSIGVVAFRAAVGPLLSRLGVASEVLTRGQHADLMTLSRELRDDERALLETHLGHAYRDFVSLVAKGRKRSVEEIVAVAGGRVWTGRDALDRGLVDALGGMDEALAQVRRRVTSTRRLEPVLLRPPRSALTGLRAMLGAIAQVNLPGASLLTNAWSVAPTALKHLVQVAASERDPVLAMWLDPRDD
jgi:protease-4